jgi:type IV fimbrial biogenesis protein FimT
MLGLMNTNRYKISQRGFTLLELLVALGILALLAGMAINGFSSTLASIRMSSQVNHLVHTLHLARHKARAIGTDIAICKSVDRRQCAPNAQWHDGWLMFANEDGDKPPHLDAGETVLATGSGQQRLRIASTRRAFIMRPPGKRSTNGSLIYCDDRGNDSARAVIISHTGKPRISPRSAGGDPLICAAEL